MQCTRYSRLAYLATASLLLAAPASAQTKRPMTFEDFSAVKNISDPQISPDGRWVMYSQRTTDVGANKRTTMTYVVASAGGTARAFPDASTPASEARWSPDGKRIAFVSGGQLWIANVDGSAKQQLTTLNGGATGPIWAPTGDRIAFVTANYPDCTTDACNVQRDKEKEENKVKAVVTEQLMFRHWNAYDPGTRSHLYVVSPNGGPVTNLTPGVRYDVPPGPFGGSEGYAFSPDGRELAYTAKDAGREDAWSTDANIYVVPVSGGASTVITRPNTGADQNPVYSPDGKYIIYTSQARGGFESDKWRLMAYDRTTKTSRELLPTWDRSADSYAFVKQTGRPANPGVDIILTANDQARNKVFRVSLGNNGRVTGPTVVTPTGNNSAPSVSADGAMMAWLQDAADRPAEVFVMSTAGGAARQLTHANDALVAQLQLYPAENFWFQGADGDSVQGFVLKPPQYTAGRKFPAILLIHGGPQGAFFDNWHGRWNYQLFASPGVGVVIINPRGSTGFGQKFTDQISGDWSGKVYTDLMNGLDFAIARNPWIDTTRLGAAGGSYGGYMVNWIAGHSNRFKALFTHAGVFNLEHMSGATEELWFTEWEFGGPWWNDKAMAEQYRRNSPHLFAKNFRTPTLVIHGELDYRVPYTEGLGMFTALQRQNVPSRLVLFPDEGHWISKPQNQRLWWNEVQGWFGRWFSPGERPKAE